MKFISRFLCAIFGHKMLPLFDDITHNPTKGTPWREKTFVCTRCESELRARDHE